MSERPLILTLLGGLNIGHSGGGGAERYGLELAQNLDQSRFEVIVCGLWERHVPEETYWLSYARDAGLETFLAASRDAALSPAGYRAALRNITARLKGRRVAIIHSHNQLGTVTALLLKRPLGAQAVMRTVHGEVHRDFGGGLRGTLLRAALSQGLFPLMLDAEAGVSQAVVDTLDRRRVARLLGKKGRLIYGGILLERFRPAGDADAKRAEIGVPPGVPVIGSVGRLMEQKGYCYLVAALPRVLREFPQARLLLVGDGELRQALQAQAAELRVAGAIIFLGSRSDVQDLYPVIDLFVLPSLFEGLPLALMEAMACGVPVIATRIPGTVELVSDGATGWLVPPADPAALAETVVKALASPAECRAAATRAAEQVVPRFSIGRAARRYEELYRHLLAQKG